MLHWKLMDSKIVKNTQNKQVEKLNKVTKRIQKARKNLKIVEKEAAEFKEIQKLLETTEDEFQNVTETDLLPEEIKSFDCSVIPMKLPGVKVFHNELIFSLFKEGDCLLRNFVKEEKEFQVFSNSKSVPSEERFRKLISYRLTENLSPEEGKCSSISLYVLYLMSVHEDPDFVASCFDFLTHHTFRIQPEDLFPIFINFGARPGDLFELCEKTFFEKFPGGNERSKGVSPPGRFPFLNLEMVGRILLQYVGENLLAIDSNVKPFVRGLVKITLEPRIRSGVLLPLYSTILATLCSRLRRDFALEEVLGWVHVEGEHLLNQLEISQNLPKPICGDFHDAFVLKILSRILDSELLPARPPLKIGHVKAALKKSYNRDLLPLELYSLLQLINGSLPTLTATVKHSTEINSLVAFLEQKISKVDDSVDLMRLKLEIAKVGNLVTNNINNRFVVEDEAKKCSAKKVKCSN